MSDAKFSFSRCRDAELFSKCIEIEPEYASKEYLLSLHSENHFDRIESTAKDKDDIKLEEVSSQYDSIFINSVSISRYKIDYKLIKYFS